MDMVYILSQFFCKQFINYRIKAIPIRGELKLHHVNMNLNTLMNPSLQMQFPLLLQLSIFFITCSYRHPYPEYFISHWIESPVCSMLCGGFSFPLFHHVRNFVHSAWKWNLVSEWIWYYNVLYLNYIINLLK